jgi:moderate conductance mechanosensitive channel
MPGLLSFLDPLQFLTDRLNLQPGEFTRAVLQIAMIWAVLWVATLVIRIVARRIEQAVDGGDDSVLTAEAKRGHTIAQLLRSVGGVVVLIIGGMLTLDVFINIGPLLAGAGIAGLAISFGAQSLVKDVITGFFILVENQFGVGDVIEAAGKTGTVEQLTLRVVLLRDIRGVVHIIPNGQIGTVSNLTRGWARAVVEVGIGYGADVDRAIEVFRDEAGRLAAAPEWTSRLDGMPEVVGVDALADSAVIIRTHFRTAAGSQWAVAREFRRRIKNRLDTEGIEIPFPQRTVHLRQGA